MTQPSSSPSGKLWDSIIGRDKAETPASLVKTEKELLSLAEFAWKTYFSPEKNKTKPWYDSSVTTENVLDQFVGSKSPISPKNLVELWKLIPKLSKSLHSKRVQRDLDSLTKSLRLNSFYGSQAPNLTFRDLKSKLGNITTTMVNKIFLSGTQKIKHLTKGVPPDEMDPVEFADLMKRIDICRQEVAREFAKSLKESNKDIKSFLLKFLTKVEISWVSEEEIEALIQLSGYEEELVVEMLLSDIEEDDNLFKTFQNAVSKEICPHHIGNTKGLQSSPGSTFVPVMETLDCVDGSG